MIRHMVIISKGTLIKRPMKTKIHMLTAILIMNFTVLYAGDPLVISTRATSKAYTVSVPVTELAPVTPMEATFTDYVPAPSSDIRPLSTITLAHVISDLIDDAAFLLPFEPSFLLETAPSTPKEAGFDDYEIACKPATGTLAPVTPANAEFEE